MHLGAQFIDLTSQPLGSFGIYLVLLFDLTRDIKLGKPIGDFRSHRRIDRGEGNGDDARRSLLVDGKLGKHAVDDDIAIRGAPTALNISHHAAQKALMQSWIEFRVLIELQISNQARNERARRQQLDFALESLCIRRVRLTVGVEIRNLAGARRHQDTAFDRVGRRHGCEPDDCQRHETGERNEDQFLASPDSTQQFPRRNIARAA